MLHFGDRIRLTGKVRRVMERRDSVGLQRVAQEQIAAGADGLVVSLGPCPVHGSELLSWLVNGIQQVALAPLLLATRNLSALRAALPQVAGPAWVAGAVTGVDVPTYAELARQHGARLVLYPLEHGYPPSVARRMGLVERAQRQGAAVGLDPDQLVVDLMVMTVNGCQRQAKQALDLATGCAAASPPISTMAALGQVADNVPSPLASWIKAVYYVLLRQRQVNAITLDALDRRMWEAIRWLDERPALLGQWPEVPLSRDADPMAQRIARIAAVIDGQEPYEALMGLSFD